MVTVGEGLDKAVQGAFTRPIPKSAGAQMRYLHGRAWTHAEGPKALFDHAVGWLRRHRVLLPGVSVLARQVSEARKVADKRLYATVAGAARRADPALPGDLVATLKTPEGSRFSELERLRRPPTRTTGTAFARALERVDEIGAYRLGRLKLYRRSRRTGWRRWPGTRWGRRRRCWSGRRSRSARRCSPR
ncbi:DUF4158 domain-containing protein [Streptomyces echinatus]|uniref:DUF4158 domain-containing protein n=1 Tax=Streptomyces echinatus TaxID=67293 RepID=UPI003787B31B